MNKNLAFDTLNAIDLFDGCNLYYKYTIYQNDIIYYTNNITVNEISISFLNNDIEIITLYNEYLIKEN